MSLGAAAGCGSSGIDDWPRRSGSTCAGSARAEASFTLLGSGEFVKLSDHYA